MYQPYAPSFRGACRAILTAGPLFISLIGAALFYMQMPAAIYFDPAAIIMVPTILLFALIFGPFVACLPILVGTIAMQGMADRIPILSARPVWAATGLAIGGVVAHVSGLLQDSGEVAFALIATCGVSAWLCHGGDADRPVLPGQPPL